MLLNEISNVLQFKPKMNFVDPNYKAAYDAAMKQDGGFPAYDIQQAVQKYKIFTKQQADANFHTQDRNSPEWVAFRSVQLSKLIQKLRKKLGKGSTDKSDYVTRVIRLNTSKLPLDGSDIGTMYVETVLGNWFSVNIEGETFLVRFPKADGLIKTVDIAPVPDSSPAQLQDMDNGIVRRLQAANNFIAHKKRETFKTVDGVERNRQSKQDIDWT